VRQLFERAVLADERLKFAFSARSIQEATSHALSAPADVYLVDLGLPDADGRDFIRGVSREQPGALTMVVTVFGDVEHIVSSLEAGAAGYLLKDTALSEIGQRIIELHVGGSPISPSVARHLIGRFLKADKLLSASAVTFDALEKPLSTREMEVLRLVEKGLSYDEIAQVMGITWNTVTGYLRRVYQKLQVNSRGEAVFEAKHRGLL
jgi:DNA-binding NarL/FixJ family response regulator